MDRKEMEYLRALGHVPAREIFSLMQAQAAGRRTPLHLDVTRFDAGTGTLCGTDGSAIGTASVQMGSTPLSELVYPAEGGLHFDGRAVLRFPISLGRRFTVVMRFRDFVKGPGQVHGFLRFSDGSLETVLDDGVPDSRAGYLFWYLVRRAGGSGQTAFNGTSPEDLGTLYRYYDMTLPPVDYPLYTHEQRYVCDGTNVSFYLNGILRARESAAAFGDPQEITIGFPVTVYAAQDAYIVEAFSVLPQAQPPVDYRLYRMRITGYRGTDSYGQLARVHLYDAAGNRLDTAARAVAYLTADTAAAVFPDASENARTLTGSRTGKACWTRGMREDCIYFSLPADGGALASYSYRTGNDEPLRDPVTWEMQTSADGGYSWQTIDERTQAAVPEARSTETGRFGVAQHG